MTRLIDADALKKENERLLHCDFPYLSETTLEELIDEAPTIDAEPLDGSFLKMSKGGYVIYQRKWLYEHLEQEFDILRSASGKPTIDAEPHWIPCSERLPENTEPVNITWVNRDPEPYYMNIKDKPFTATGIYFKGKWYWDSVTCEDILGEYGENEIDEVDGSIEITAWMPLPKPYEGDMREES